MVMNRRGFMKSGMAASTFAGLALAGKVDPVLARIMDEPPTVPRPGIHILGPEAVGADGRLMRGLSDDVFERLIQAYRRVWLPVGRTLRCVDLSRPGDHTIEGELREQWNTSWVMAAAFTTDHPPYFDLAAFRGATNRWIRGTWMCPERYGVVPDVPPPVAEMFGAARIIGMPILPSGLLWAAHYVDEDTGLVMRALFDYKANVDEFLMRWDVVCG